MRVESSSLGLERFAVSGWTDGQSSCQGVSGTSGSVTSLGCVDPLLVSEGDDHSQHGGIDQTHQLRNEIPGLQESNSTNVSPGDLSSLYFSISPGTSDGDVQFDPPVESHIGQRNTSENECPSYGEKEPYFPVRAIIQESCLLRYFIEELSPLVNQFPIHNPSQILTYIVRPLRRKKAFPISSPLPSATLSNAPQCTFRSIIPPSRQTATVHDTTGRALSRPITHRFEELHCIRIHAAMYPRPCAIP